MSVPPANPNAFPLPEWMPSESGMTLRDYFAASAMQGILANADGNIQSDALAENCYLAADAMLKAREAKA
jgi:hypothetical protein